MLAFSIPLQHLCIFMLLQPAPTHAVRSSAGRSIWSHSIIPSQYVCCFSPDGTHPVFCFLYFSSPLFVFFLFLAGEPVPVGFKPIRWLRPQPIPFPVVQKVFPLGQSYPELLMPLVSDFPTGSDIPSSCSPGYFPSECELTSGPGLFCLPQLLTIQLRTLAVGFLH